MRELGTGQREKMVRNGMRGMANEMKRKRGDEWIGKEEEEQDGRVEKGGWGRRRKRRGEGGRGGGIGERKGNGGGGREGKEEEVRRSRGRVCGRWGGIGRNREKEGKMGWNRMKKRRGKCEGRE